MVRFSHHPTLLGTNARMTTVRRIFPVPSHTKKQWERPGPRATTTLLKLFVEYIHSQSLSQVCWPRASDSQTWHLHLGPHKAQHMELLKLSSSARSQLNTLPAALARSTPDTEIHTQNAQDGKAERDPCKTYVSVTNTHHFIMGQVLHYWCPIRRVYAELGKTLPSWLHTEVCSCLLRCK